MTTGPVNAPDVPTELKDEHRIDFLKLRYQEELDAWQAAWKQMASDNAALTAVEATAQAALLTVAANASTAKALADAATAAALAAVNAANAQADRANEAALRKDIHDAYVASSQASLDRAMTRVNYLTAAITAVTGLYTGLLALVYSADPTKGKAFTAVALLPALFLGLSLFLVTIWAAMFRSSRRNVAALSTSVGGLVAQQRLAIFMEWCSNIIVSRSWALHAGIVSFGIGVATLPLPFVKLQGWQQLLVLLGGLLLVGITAGQSKYSQLDPKPRRDQGWTRIFAIFRSSADPAPTAAKLPGGAAYAPVLGDQPDEPNNESRAEAADLPVRPTTEGEQDLPQ